MPDESDSVESVLGELDELAATHREVCIRDALDDFGQRSFGPFILLPAMLEITPIGGIPGMPTLLATIVAITAFQLLLGRDHVWMPEILQRRAVSGKSLHKAVGKLRGIAQWLDNHSAGRLEAMTEGIWLRMVGLVIVLLCGTVPPLEFLPFASSLPMLAIAVLGLALTVRDGALVLASLVFAAIASTAGGYLFATYEAAETLAG